MKTPPTIVWWCPQDLILSINCKKTAERIALSTARKCLIASFRWISLSLWCRPVYVMVNNTVLSTCNRWCPSTTFVSSKTIKRDVTPKSMWKAATRIAFSCVITVLMIPRGMRISVLIMLVKLYHQLRGRLPILTKVKPITPQVKSSTTHQISQHSVWWTTMKKSFWITRMSSEHKTNQQTEKGSKASHLTIRVLSPKPRISSRCNSWTMRAMFLINSVEVIKMRTR